jgi:hypothetical protein
MENVTRFRTLKIMEPRSYDNTIEDPGKVIELYDMGNKYWLWVNSWFEIREIDRADILQLVYGMTWRSQIDEEDWVREVNKMKWVKQESDKGFMINELIAGYSNGDKEREFKMEFICPGCKEKVTVENKITKE